MTLITTGNEKVERINKRTLKIIFFIVSPSLCQGDMNCNWQLAVGRRLPTARCYQLSDQGFTENIRIISHFARTFRVRGIYEKCFFYPIL